MQYIRKYLQNAKMSTPTLEKRNHKWFLRFAFTEEVKIPTVPINNQTILAVDLGINTDATCSVMDSNGTIFAREFINFASDKDRIYHALNKIKGIQQKYGSRTHNTAKLWRDVVNHNDEDVVTYGVSHWELSLNRIRRCKRCLAKPNIRTPGTLAPWERHEKIRKAAEPNMPYRLHLPA